jgi:hypothetical protein
MNSLRLRKALAVAELRDGKVKGSRERLAFMRWLEGQTPLCTPAP